MSLNAFCVIVLAVWLLVGLGSALFFEYKKLEELESYFSENELVQRTKRFWSQNRRIDRVARTIVIVEFFTLTKTSIKRRDTTEEELAAVPIALRRWTTWPYYSALMWLVASFIWMAWREW